MVRPTQAERDRALQLPARCSVCGHARAHHGRMQDMVSGVRDDRREVCLECPGYVVEIGGVDEDGYYHGGAAWHRFKGE